MDAIKFAGCFSGQFYHFHGTYFETVAEQVINDLTRKILLDYIWFYYC
jgi:hypothetical protein